MTTLTILQPAQADILNLIDRNPNLQPSTKKQYKKGSRAKVTRVTHVVVTGASGLSRSEVACETV